jgi:hypothetical protein
MEDRSAQPQQRRDTAGPEYVQPHDAPEVAERQWSSIPDLSAPEAIAVPKSEKEPVPVRDNIEVYRKNAEDEFGHPYSDNLCGVRRRTFYWLLAVSAIIITVAAVLGGVLGSVLGHSDGPMEEQ